MFGVNETNSGMFVCKTPFCTQNADDFDLHDYEEMRYDAVIFESFSSDKYFVDLYGHCGLSVFAEYMPYGDIDVVATPIFNTDRYGGNNFTDEEMLQMNQLEPEFKLRVAIEMTEAVEHLHNFESGRIVHGDLHLVQFLFTKEGKEDWKNARQVLKISDFNMALFLPYNEVEGEYCKVYSGVGGGDVSAAACCCTSFVLVLFSLDCSGVVRRSTKAKPWMRRWIYLPWGWLFLLC